MELTKQTKIGNALYTTSDHDLYMVEIESYNGNVPDDWYFIGICFYVDETKARFLYKNYKVEYVDVLHKVTQNMVFEFTLEELANQKANIAGNDRHIE